MRLVALGLAWLGGIAAVAMWNAPPWLPAVSAAALLPLAFRRGIPVHPIFVALMAVMAFSGALRFATWEEAPPPGLVEYLGEEIEVSGVVQGLPDPGTTTTRYEIAARELFDELGALPADGSILVTLPEYTELEPGARVRVRGTLDAPPVLEEFDYAAYLARQGIAGTMFYPSLETTAPAPTWSRTRIVSEVRARLESALQRSLPEPAASVAAGISLGRPGTVPNELYDDYRDAGLAHILAVSGAHISVLSGIVFFGLLQVMGRRQAIWPAIAVVVAYVFLTGAPFSVIRAGIMAVIFLFGIYLGRQQASLAALAAAAIAMTLVRPATALEAGFQLSLSATAGLIVFGPWIRWLIGTEAERLQIRGIVPPLAEHVAALSLAASIATAPVLWVTFGRVPLIGPLSNVLVEPIFALAFALSLVTAVTGVIWEPAGWAVGLVAYYPLSLLSWTASTFASVPHASVDVPRTPADAALGAFVMMAIPGWFAYRYLAPIPERPPATPGERRVRRLALGAAAGALAMGVAWHSLVPLRGPGELEVTMLDVGQGDAILVTTPGGSNVLVDGGPSGIVLARELGAALPHWQRNLTKTVATHPEADHIGGFPAAFERFNVRTAYDNGDDHDTLLASMYEELRSGRHETLATGDRFTVDGVSFTTLWPGGTAAGMGPNDRSVVLRVDYGATSFLLTGDIEREPQWELEGDDALDVTVLKVPHHGAATSTRGFFEAVDAPIALISAGEENRYGHPADVTLRQLHGAEVFRTDIQGRVTVRSDGERVSVVTQR